jgi:hypothetical protein
METNGERERDVLLETRLSVLRQLEVTVAAKHPEDVGLLAAIRELIADAEAEQRAR